MCVCVFRTQAAAEVRPAGAEEEQEERLLQGARNRQERHRRRDQEGLPQASPHAPSGYAHSYCAPLGLEVRFKGQGLWIWVKELEPGVEL